MAERRSIESGPNATPIGHNSEQSPAIGQDTPDLPQHAPAPGGVLVGRQEAAAVLPDEQHGKEGEGREDAELDVMLESLSTERELEIA